MSRDNNCTNDYCLCFFLVFLNCTDGMGDMREVGDVTWRLPETSVYAYTVQNSRYPHQFWIDLASCLVGTEVSFPRS